MATVGVALARPATVSKGRYQAVSRLPQPGDFARSQPGGVLQQLRGRTAVCWSGGRSEPILGTGGLPAERLYRRLAQFGPGPAIAKAIHRLRSMVRGHRRLSDIAWPDTQGCHRVERSRRGLLADDQTEKASECYQRASELSPATPEIWFNLGVALAQAENTDSAGSALQRAVSLQPRRLISQRICSR